MISHVRVNCWEIWISPSRKIWASHDSFFVRAACCTKKILSACTSPISWVRTAVRIRSSSNKCSWSIDSCYTEGSWKSELTHFSLSVTASSEHAFNEKEATEVRQVSKFTCYETKFSEEEVTKDVATCCALPAAISGSNRCSTPSKAFSRKSKKAGERVVAILPSQSNKSKTCHPSCVGNFG